MVKIEPKKISYTVDQSNQNIEEFWERIPEQSNRQAVSCNELILNLCKKSKEMIIIHTPKLTLPELQIELEKLSSKGVRIYSLTSDIKKHQKIFQKGIMREKKETLSTYVLIDSQTKPHGICCPGELSSASSPPYALELNGKQIKELWQHFSHEFWNAKGQELFYAKIRKTPEYDGTKLKINDALDLTARVPDKMFKRYTIERIESVYLPENIPSDFQEHMLAKKVYTKISERTKELILEIDHNTDLFGTSFRSMGYLKGNGPKGNIGIVFDGDIAILLDDTQLERVEKNLPKPEWQYRVTKRLSDISGEILLSESNWDNLKPDRIETEGEKRLKDIESKSIEEWNNGLPRPKIPDFGGLYRQVKYTWTLHPPYLPKGSKKHRLYDMWASFDKNLSKKIDRLISEMEEANKQKKKLSSIKKTKKITLEDKIHEWIGKLDSIKQQEWKNKPTSISAEEAIQQISEIENEFLKEIKGLEPKKKKDGSNELEEILPNPSREKTEIKIPPKTLPTRGVLFEKGNNSYIAIKDTEDLKYVEPFRKEHRATIVTERD